MKLIYRILVAIVFLAGLSACTHKSSFTSHSFVSLSTLEDNDTFSPRVSESDSEIQIPVVVFNNPGKAFTVTFAAKDGTAEAGTNYNILEPESGVLTFSATDSVKYITVEIINQENLYTGSLSFSVSLLGATEGVELGASTQMNITITDDDHPLSAILGTYLCYAYALSGGSAVRLGWYVNFTADDDDTSIVWIDYLLPFFYSYSSYGDGSVPAQVSEDLSTITIADGQETVSFNVGYGTQAVYSCYYMSGYYLAGDDIVLTATDTGFETEQGICCADYYVWPSYYGWLLGAMEGDYKTTYTKVTTSTSSVE